MAKSAKKVITYESIVEMVRGKIKDADPSKVSGFLAIQVNITGEGEGAFYIEVKDGKINVEPYTYNDRQACIVMNSKDFIDLVDKKLDPVLAFTLGKLKVEGSIDKALEFSKLLK